MYTTGVLDTNSINNTDAFTAPMTKVNTNNFTTTTTNIAAISQEQSEIPEATLAPKEKHEDDKTVAATATTCMSGDDIVREVLAMNTMAMQKCVLTTKSSTAFMPASPSLPHLTDNKKTSVRSRTNSKAKHDNTALSRTTIAEELSAAAVLLLEAFEKLSNVDNKTNSTKNDVRDADNVNSISNNHNTNNNAVQAANRNSAEDTFKTDQEHNNNNTTTENNKFDNESTAKNMNAQETMSMLNDELRDQLKAITLNNMGVVECHRGQPRRALSHFEAARQIEENWNFTSPSLALNTCAVYNALKMYDKATAAALETIEMLRTLEYQRKRRNLYDEESDNTSVQNNALYSDNEQKKKKNMMLFQTSSSSNNKNGNQLTEHHALSNSPLLQQESEEEVLMMAAAAQPTVADSNNLSLWGAAWHNLAVAQLNTALHSHHSYDVIRSNTDDNLFQQEQKYDTINTNSSGNGKIHSGSSLINSSNNRSGNTIGSNMRTATSNHNEDDDDDESINTISYFHAQLNKERMKGDVSEHTNTLALFRNAMRATMELLGLHHPMTCAVIETYRSVRRCLYKHGAFTRHRTCATAPLPPADPHMAFMDTSEGNYSNNNNSYYSNNSHHINYANNPNTNSNSTKLLSWANMDPELVAQLKQSTKSRTTHRSSSTNSNNSSNTRPFTLTSSKALHELQQRQLLITFRGEVTKGAKATEMLVKTPYPGAENDDENAFVQASYTAPVNWKGNKYNFSGDSRNTNKHNSCNKRAPANRFVRHHLRETAKIYSRKHNDAPRNEYYDDSDSIDDFNVPENSAKYKNSYLLPDIYEMRQNRHKKRHEWSNDNNTNKKSYLHSNDNNVLYNESNQSLKRSKHNVSGKESRKTTKKHQQQHHYDYENHPVDYNKGMDERQHHNNNNNNGTLTVEKRNDEDEREKRMYLQKMKELEQQHRRDEDRKYYEQQKAKQQMEREQRQQAVQARRKEMQLQKKYAQEELQAQKKLMRDQRERSQLKQEQKQQSKMYNDIHKNAPKSFNSSHMRVYNEFNQFSHDFGGGGYHSKRYNDDYTNEERNAMSAVANVELEQPKFILLAQPPVQYNVASLASDSANVMTGKNADMTADNDTHALQTGDVAQALITNTTNNNNASDNNSIKPSTKDGMTQVDDMLPESMYGNTNSNYKDVNTTLFGNTNNNNNTSNIGEEVNALIIQTKSTNMSTYSTPRELFSAMWVAADANYIYHGKRSFKLNSNSNSPVCRRLSQVMNVSADGELLTGMEDAVMRRDRSTTPILMMMKDVTASRTDDMSTSSTSSSDFSNETYNTSSTDSISSDNDANGKAKKEEKECVTDELKQNNNKSKNNNTKSSIVYSELHKTSKNSEIVNSNNINTNNRSDQGNELLKNRGDETANPSSVYDSNDGNDDYDDRDERESKISVTSTKSKSRTITPSAFSNSV